MLPHLDEGPILLPLGRAAIDDQLVLHFLYNLALDMGATVGAVVPSVIEDVATLHTKL